MGPLIYYYCQLMMGKKVTINYKTLLPFTTAMIPLGCWIYYETCYTTAEQFVILKDAFNAPPLLAIMTAGIEFQFLFFMGLSLYSVRQHNKKVKDIYTDKEKIKLAWVNEFVILMLGLTIAMLISRLVFSTRIMNLIAMPILSNIFYFYIIYQSFNNSILFNKKEFTNFQQEFERMNVIEEKKEKYQSSIISEEQIIGYGKELNLLMNSKSLFLNPELNLKALSNILNIPSHLLSEVINRYFEMSFFDLINSFRVKYAEEKLRSQTSDHLTLEAIAEECGFGSKSAFNRAFKKNTGSTPSEYRKRKFVHLCNEV